MKISRRNNGSRRQPADLLVFAVLFCLFALSTGCVISPRRIVGGTPTPTPTPPSGSGQGLLYVSIPGANTILRFSSAGTANGAVNPAATITGGTLNSPQGMFIDEAADRLYVANQAAASILVFNTASTANGTVTPARTISGANTSLLSPSGVVVDTVKDILYVSDGVDLLAFNGASTVNGNATPARDIKFGFTIAAMYMDSSADRLFIADSGANAINIFDNVSTLNVTAAPSRALFGAATQLNQPSGVGVDSPGKLVVANAGSNSITVYVNAMAVNGNTAPAFVISGSNTTLNSPAQIAVNKSSTKVEVFIANTNGNNIPIYSDLGSVSNNVAPSRNISGSSLLSLPVGVALDTTR
jgi:hypothetical protein